METYMRGEFREILVVGEIEEKKYVKERKESRQRAMETWKKEDIEVRDVTEEWNARWMKKKKYKEVLL